MSVDTTTASAPQEKVDTTMSTLRSELARSDSKASLLLALTGGSLAAILSAAADATFPAAVMVVGSMAAVALLCATVILLLAVRPRLGGAGWPTWHQLPLTALAEEVSQGQRVAEVQVLARTARTKFRRIRIAVDCALAGIALLTLAGILAITN